MILSIFAWRVFTFVGFIVGSGEAEDYYKEYVKASFLENKIYFIGEFPYIDLLQITASADVGLALISSNSISYKYALPNKLFEYAICGVPCLSHNIPNMKKYISKYQLGLCVDNSTTNQIEGINFLLKKNKPIKFPNSLSWKSQEKKFINIIHSFRNKIFNIFIWERKWWMIFFSYNVPI